LPYVSLQGEGSLWQLIHCEGLFRTSQFPLKPQDL
jgi:hypothetical protein